MITTPSTTVPRLVEEDPTEDDGLETGVGVNGDDAAGVAGGKLAEPPGGMDPCGIDPMGIDPCGGIEFCGGVKPGCGIEPCGGMEPAGWLPPGGRPAPEKSAPTISTPQWGQCWPTGGLGPRLITWPHFSQTQTRSITGLDGMVGGRMFGTPELGLNEPAGLGLIGGWTMIGAGR